MADVEHGPEQPAEEFAAKSDAVLAADAVEKINAGAQLIYALYCHPKAQELLTNDEFATRGLVNAYMRATSAYGIGG